MAPLTRLPEGGARNGASRAVPPQGGTRNGATGPACSVCLTEGGDRNGAELRALGSLDVVDREDEFGVAPASFGYIGG